MAEVYRQLSSHSTYTDFTEKSNRIFEGLCNKKIITKKELKYFSFSYKNACSLGKMYLLPKTHQRLFDVPERPKMSYCGTPTEKVSEFSDHHLQPVMKGVDLTLRLH